jgi:hypothetical protein
MLETKIKESRIKFKRIRHYVNSKSWINIEKFITVRKNEVEFLRIKERNERKYGIVIKERDHKNINPSKLKSNSQKTSIDKC